MTKQQNCAPSTVPNAALTTILADFRSYISSDSGKEELAKAINFASRKPDSVTHNKYGINISNRAKIIVWAANSKASSLRAMAEEIGFSQNKLSRWLSRFIKYGVLGLRTRSPKQRRTCMTKDVQLELDRLLQLEVSTVPKEDKYKHLQGMLCFSSTHWTGRALARCLRVSEATICRYLKRTGRSLTASIGDSYCISTDEDFEPKLKDITQLLQRDLADDEVGYCVDEKTCISAICDEYGFDNKGQVRKGCRWIRNGTTNLLAALDFKTGKLDYYEFKETKTRADFIAFLTKLVELPKNRNKRVYIILDNLATHKSFGDEWYNKYQNIKFLFTPKCCSWANPIESFFGIFQKGCLKVRLWPDVQEIHKRAHSFFEAYNNQARPYHFSLDIERYLAQRKQNLYNLNQVLAFETSPARARSSRLASTFIAALNKAAEILYRSEHPKAKAQDVREHLKDITKKLSTTINDYGGAT